MSKRFEPKLSHNQRIARRIVLRWSRCPGSGRRKPRVLSSRYEQQSTCRDSISFRKPHSITQSRPTKPRIMPTPGLCRVHYSSYGWRTKKYLMVGIMQSIFSPPARRLVFVVLQRRLNAIAEAHKAPGWTPSRLPPSYATPKGDSADARGGAGTEDRRIDERHPGHGSRHRRGLDRRAGPGADPARVRGRLQTRGASPTERGRLRVQQRWPDSDTAAVQIDQTGEGRKIGIPYGSNPETCPVRAIQTWTEQAGVTAGPLFRSINRHGKVQPGRLGGIDVARVTKKLAARGPRSCQIRRPFPPGRIRNQCGDRGRVGAVIMKQTGHRNVQMVRRYIRDGSLFRENSAGRLWGYSSSGVAQCSAISVLFKPFYNNRTGHGFLWITPQRPTQ